MSKNLPPHYMITGKFADTADFRRKLERSLQAGPKVIQLRGKGLDDDAYLDLAHIAEDLCRSVGATLLLATSADVFAQTDADGLHLSSDKLAGLGERPVAADKLLSVSCHKDADLKLADRLGADLLLLSPVKPTSSHPELAGLGWDRFREMSAPFSQPVYGLGGMKIDDLADALTAGAQGIAASVGLWP